MIILVAVGYLASFYCLKCQRIYFRNDLTLDDDFAFDDENGVIDFNGKTLYELFHKDDNLYNVTWIMKYPSMKRIDVILRLPFKSWKQDKNVIVVKETGMHGNFKKMFNQSFDDHFIGNGTVEISLSGLFSNDTSNLNLEIKFRPWCSKCEKSFLLTENTSVNIQSPNFPMTFYPGCACVWYVYGKSTKPILKLTQKSFQLKGRLPNRECQDFLEIYKGVHAIKENSYGRFCGTELVYIEFDHWITLTFHSHNNFNYSATQKYGFDIVIYNNSEDSGGLQTIAAILGAISLGIFIGLLICSIFYKRWYKQPGDVLEIANLVYNEATQITLPDAIQAAAPPSYTKVIESPKMFPAVKRENSFTIHHLEIPTSNPPHYSMDDINDIDHIPLPSYASVSESEEEWFSTRSLNESKRYSSDNFNQDPPSYEKVKSESSILPPISTNAKVKIHRKSRSVRNSVSSMALARDAIKKADSENKKQTGGHYRSKTTFKKAADSRSFILSTNTIRHGDESTIISLKTDACTNVNPSVEDETNNIELFE
ncbi:uncharacterized protein LOC101240159 isoform X2 [Hydra vulgaris]|uniref:uncharacterized protein LOC101240159 isoform X2 n=1 Tax=Hydra vulgaris TaxID=6087 RepID=UPI0032EA009C